ncbi:site-specific recombinase XerD [Saccharopolyspora lacisalsi]|uniref:Site-specific recombinase XerD n=1 Tax=Halosaccharopolyspora lacisalsi TaxID=1000566 RepID=A0A839DXI4_9PSEU|nr:tyrosine-type recombinase/integrase [Halosaccharopolyspora lacisalsi]MBA8823931.1 site-specific recombinase XerD [Halosaccharopolyspora lacisalsi]
MPQHSGQPADSDGPQIALFGPTASPEVRAELDAAARAHVDAGRNAATRRAYDSDRRAWNAYCSAFDIGQHELSVGTLVGFVEWLISHDAAPRTIERRVTGTRRSLRDDGVADLDIDDREIVAERQRQYQRALAEHGLRRGRGKARPITVAELRQLSRVLDDTLLGLRDRALLLVAFGMAARRSEVAGLWAADVAVADEGLVVTLRTSKTSDDDTDIAIPHGTSALTCPVRAWRAYRTALATHLGTEPTGRAFRRIDRHGRVLSGMSGQAVNLVLQRTATAAGLDLTRVSAHGLRAGLATEARRAGHDATTIATQGRWSPNGSALYGYLHIVERWDDNAVKGIGL